MSFTCLTLYFCASQFRRDFQGLLRQLWLYTFTILHITTTVMLLHMASITCRQVTSMSAMSLGLQHSLRISIWTSFARVTAHDDFGPCNVLILEIRALIAKDLCQGPLSYFLGQGTTQKGIRLPYVSYQSISLKCQFTRSMEVLVRAILALLANCTCQRDLAFRTQGRARPLSLQSLQNSQCQLGASSIASSFSYLDVVRRDFLRLRGGNFTIASFLHTHMYFHFDSIQYRENSISNSSSMAYVDLFTPS